MVYECEKCTTPLPPGVRACPNCGDQFEESVPTDAEVPRRGFVARSDASASAVTTSSPSPATIHTNAVETKQNAVETKQIVALISAAILFVGVFTPILSVPVIGSVNYFQNGKGDGTILIALALISAVLALTRKYDGLWVMGALSLGLLIFSFLNMQGRLSGMQGSMDADLAGNPFKGLGDAFVQGVQIQWGWALLVVGALLLVGAAALRSDTAWKPDRAWPIVSAVLLLLIVTGSFAYTQSEKSRSAAAAKAKVDQKAREDEAKARQDQRDQDAAAAEQQSKQDAINQLHLANTQWQDTEFMRNIVGTVRNDSDRQFTFVSVNFDLLDKDGNKVGTAEDMIESLDPGQTWKFKAMVTSDTAIRTQLNELKGTAGDKVPGAVAVNPDMVAPTPTPSTVPGQDPILAVASLGSGLSNDPLSRSAVEDSVVTEEDLRGKSLAAASISYNTIYAVHGYIFKKASLRHVFAAKSWYHPNPAFSEKDLTAKEQTNLKTIRSYERSQFGY